MISLAAASAASIITLAASGVFLQRCAECQTPIFEMRWDGGGASLIVKSRHHGKKHETVVSLAALRDVMVQE